MRTDDALVDALLVTSRALVGVAARSLADAKDVTLPQFRALVVLASHPRLTVTELAAALDIHASTATRMCDRLVAKRLVLRQARPGDRRIVELRLAAGGRKLVDRVTERRREAIRSIVFRLPPGVSEAVIEALDAFGRAAGEVLGDDPFGWQLASATQA